MATPGTEIVELETGVFARLHEGLTNAGIIIGDDSVLIIDSLRVPSFARDLIKDVKDITDKPIKFVIDTHSHWDHSWGNEEFPDATIIGHKNCYAEMIDVEWNDEWRRKVVGSGDPWSEEGNIVTITPPNMTFETSMQLYFGGRELNLLYFGRAHTSGDTYIHLPKDKIVFTGDVAQDGGVPYLGDSYPADWPETDNKLASLPIERFMSGHGPIGDHHALEEARDFIHNLVNSLNSAISDGQDSDQASESVIKELTPQYASWRSFDRIGENLPGVYRKLKV